MTRLALQLLLILVPFFLFALYRFATADKRTFGEKWPFALLTLVGLALSVSFYLIAFLREPRGDRTCATPPRFENGKVIEGEVVACKNASVDARKNGKTRDDD